MKLKESYFQMFGLLFRRENIPALGRTTADAVLLKKAAAAIKLLAKLDACIS